MAITLSDFAEDCILQGLYCGVNPHYLLGVAKLRSDINDNTQGNQIGPFRLTQEAWNAHCTDTEFDFNFLPSDIKDWDMQVPVFALMAHRAFDAFVLDKKRNPSAKEWYLQQWSATAPATLSTELLKALNDTAALLGPASDAILEKPVPSFEITDPDNAPTAPPQGAISLASIVPQARRDMANKIQVAFKKAKLGAVQQAAAIANAIAESNLDPTSHAAIGEDSWGLFQLNRKGGLGKGHNPDELLDPDSNIAIVIAEAKKYKEFVMATTIDQAVSAFVRDVERPRDVPGQIIHRLAFAQKLLA